MAKDLAIALRKRYLIRDDILTDVEIEMVAQGEGLVLETRWPFDRQFGEHFPEICLRGHLFLRPDLTRPWRRWLTLHALGHHELHRGNHIQMYRSDQLALCRQEEMAERFAGDLLLGPLLWDQQRLSGVTISVLAETVEVPEECLANWWRIARDHIHEVYRVTQRIEQAWYESQRVARVS